MNPHVLCDLTGVDLGVNIPAFVSLSGRGLSVSCSFPCIGLIPILILVFIGVFVGVLWFLVRFLAVMKLVGLVLVSGIIGDTGGNCVTGLGMDSSGLSLLVLE